VNIAWIDFETNDLDPRTCTPLEVACIITDDAFKEIERYHEVIYWDGSAKGLDWLANGVEAGLNNLKYESRVEYLTRKRGSSACGFWVDPIVIDMHLQNGLWKESVTGAALDTVDRQLSAFIGRCGKPPLAGSSVWYDREVMRNHMPRTFAALHYRTIDVSTIIEVSKRTWPTVEAGRPTSRKHHRAMTDIEDSLELMRYYTQALGPAASNVPELTADEARAIRNADHIMDDDACAAYTRKDRDALQGLLKRARILSAPSSTPVTCGAV
jgi:oligoribonuclease (3'-5' exoribonuclease)